MLRFIFRKIASKKWMFLALLIGNILLVSIACSNPLYSNAVMQRMLNDDMDAYLLSRNSYPGNIIFSFGGTQQKNGIVQKYETLAHSLPEKYGVKAHYQICHLYTPVAANNPEIVRDDTYYKNAALGSLTDLDKHAKIIAGRMYSDKIREDGVIEVVVSQTALIDLNVLLGERRTFPKYTDKNGVPVTVEVVGVYDILDTSDTYWVRQPKHYKSEYMMPEDIFRELFVFDGSKLLLNAAWYEVLDAHSMLSRNASSMQSVIKEMSAIDKDDKFITISTYFENILNEHIKMKSKVGVTLWVLQAPIYILLIAFIFMVSRQILETEAAEIAVLKSRGVKNRQILGVYFTQSILLNVVSFIAGVPLGVLITQVLGSANAFLEFVSRRALPIEVTLTPILYALAGCLIAVIAMVFPVRKYTRGSIVTQKQKKNRKQKPLWRKAFLDVIALGVSIYGLYSFNNQKEMIAQRILQGEMPDPLLLLCSSLFIIGAGLLAIRVIPALITVVYHLFKRFWSPALYASFLKVLRQRSNQDFIMIFLIMTIALGVFNAQTASTINENGEKNIRYLSGADIVLRESWSSNSEQVQQNPSLDLIYYEPDFGVYETMDGVQSAARVYRNDKINASVSGGTVNNILLFAIDTDDFGKTAYFDLSLYPEHPYHFLNAMAYNARAVLLSSNFRDQYGFEVGDVINYQNTAKDSSRGIVYGFVDYWPGYQPFVYRKGTDGIYRESPNYLIVANLSQVQDAFGLRPYEVWIDAKDDAGFIYEYAEENEIRFPKFIDMEAEIVEGKNDPMLKSLNGVLTVGFIVVLALCIIGFLMYWILSIRQRTLQFGIYRAMGMSMREIFTMLINEQILISVVSIVLGGAIGFIASSLFMPMIQIAYSSFDNALPLTNALNITATTQLFSVVGSMLLLSMMILGIIVKRMKIAQALKLGED
ncbi:MAG: ABC transporter permease [Clostridia bacterium]|nr:ABC transporter permease [Clostridia bacterium]